MRLADILPSILPDETELMEASVVIFKKIGNKTKRYYRCTSGTKAGAYASSPSACFQRKNPKRVVHGKKVARSHKAIRTRKSKITSKKAAHNMLKRVNRRLTLNKPMQHRKGSHAHKPKGFKWMTKSKSTVKSKGSK